MKKLCYICEGLIFVAFGFLMGMVGYKVDSFEFWFMLALLFLLDVMIRRETEIEYSEKYFSNNEEVNEDD
ncbi:hypothetical protein F140042L4_20510 [Coprococcus phoceensis]